MDVVPVVSGSVDLCPAVLVITTQSSPRSSTGRSGGRERPVENVAFRTAISANSSRD